MELKFIKTHVDAKLPTTSNDSALTGDSGRDLYSVESTLIPARCSVVVPVGLKLAYMTEGYWFRIESRSGLSFKHGLEAFNGIIDNGYRGDLGALIKNRSDKDVVLEKGERIAQIVVYPLIAPELEFVEEAAASARGEDGFGSTGKF